MKLKFEGEKITVIYKGKAKTFKSLEKAILYGLGYGSGISAKIRYSNARKVKNAL